RRELTAFARAMNERREPLGKSVHGVIGELTGLQHLPQAPGCDSIDTMLTAVELARIYDAADALPRSWGPVERGDDFLWRSLVDGTLTQSRRGSLLGTFGRALGVLDELESGTRALADDTGLPWRFSIPDAWRFDALLALLRQGLEASTDLASALDVPPPRTASELRGLLELGSLVFSPHKPSGIWLDAAKLPEVRVAVDALEPHVNKVKASLATIEILFN